MSLMSGRLSGAYVLGAAQFGPIFLAADPANCEAWTAFMPAVPQQAGASEWPVAMSQVVQRWRLRILLPEAAEALPSRHRAQV